MGRVPLGARALVGMFRPPLLLPPPCLLQALSPLDKGGSVGWFRANGPRNVETLHSLFLRSNKQTLVITLICTQVHPERGAKACGITIQTLRVHPSLKQSGMSLLKSLYEVL